MSAEKKKQMGVLGLIVALMVVLVGSLVFVGATAGWFDDPKVVLSEEFKCSDDCGLVDLMANEYEELVKEGKSFVVFIDQGGCTTADRLREYVTEWGANNGVKVQRMMFEDMKSASLHDLVKYYPSVVMVSQGRVIAYLRADAAEDADIYNDYEAFKEWMSRYF